VSADPRLHGPEFCPRVCALCACEDGRSRHCWTEDSFDPGDPDGEEADERQKAVFAWDLGHGTDHCQAFYGCRHCRAWAEAEYVWGLEGED
jgi:hypothetical protein